MTKHGVELKILVSMDRAQSGDLGTLYFYACRLFPIFSHFDDKKMAKIANFSMSICIVQ